MKEASLEIRLFGPFDARVGGQPLPRLRSRKGHWLLALLALRRNRAVEREWLAGTLWPESLQSQGYANLRLCLADLRRALGKEAKRLHAPAPHTLGLDLEGADVDVIAFDAAIARGDAASLEAAVALYGGPLLEGCLEEWVLPEREARAQAYLGALETLAANAMNQDNPAEAVRCLRLALAADPLRETALRALIQALARGGSYAAAVLAYREFRLLLQREMAAEPDGETQAAFRQIRAEARRRAQPPTASPPVGQAASDDPPSNLPRQRSSFVGRERETDAVTRLFAGGRDIRLVTLTGAGGCGKTRLALRVGEALLRRYPDGVWFVDLAPLADPSLVPQAVAAALGVREDAGRPLAETLAGHLRRRRALLILDNCEHLIDACARLADRLLRESSDLHLLATSRERLRLSGEFVYGVPPLALPARSEALSPESAGRYESVRLFAERAVFSQPAFALTEENVSVVAQMCRQLDGMPLAIELAAARIRTMPPEQIALRLHDRFRLLRGGDRAALPRQQSLQALVDWSYDLLDAPERRLLRRLGVFSGGWTLAAAEAICSGDGIEASEVWELLESLADKSLVVVAGETRYGMLETIRQHGAEKLAAAGEAEALRERHRDWFLRFAERADAELWGARAAEWLDRFEAEHDNLRAALAWSRARPGDGETWLRLAGALWRFWYMRGYWTEGRTWLEEALRHTENGTSAARATALVGAGVLAWEQADYRRARPLLEEGRAIRQGLGDRQGIAFALIPLGSLAAAQGDYERATALLQESLALCGEIGDTFGAVASLAALSRAAHDRGEHAAARALCAECSRRAREAGHEWVRARALFTLASVAVHEESHEQAEALCEQGLAIAQQVGNRWGVAQAPFLLGRLARRRGDLAKARALFRESLQRFAALGDREGVCYLLEGFAGLAADTGRFEETARLFAAAESQREITGIPLPPVYRPERDRALLAARAALGEEAFARAGFEGRGMTPEQAVARALDDG